MSEVLPWQTTRIGHAIMSNAVKRENGVKLEPPSKFMCLQHQGSLRDGGDLDACPTPIPTIASPLSSTSLQSPASVVLKPSASVSVKPSQAPACPSGLHSADAAAGPQQKIVEFKNSKDRLNHFYANMKKVPYRIVTSMAR